VIVALGVAALPLVAAVCLAGRGGDLGGHQLHGQQQAVWLRRPGRYCLSFIFFGLVGTMGTYFLQAQAWNWLVFWPATAVGLLSVAVLNVNNIRDIESDRQAGKRLDSGAD
jgi:hypothetical protein